MTTLSRERVLDNLKMLQDNCLDNATRRLAHQLLDEHDASQRDLLVQREEEMTDLESAVDVVQSTRDILLSTLTLREEEIERLKAEMGYHEANDVIAQLASQVADLTAQLTAMTDQRAQDALDGQAKDAARNILMTLPTSDSGNYYHDDLVPAI